MNRMQPNRLSFVALITVAAALALTFSAPQVFADDHENSGRAGRFELHPLLGIATTKALQVQSGTILGAMYGLELDYNLTNKFAIGASYSRASYEDVSGLLNSTFGAGAPTLPASITGPTAESFRLSARLTPLRLVALAPFVKLHVGRLKLSQDPNTITLGATSVTVPGFSIDGFAYGYGVGSALTIGPRMQLYGEALNVLSNITASEFPLSEGRLEDFWILQASLSFRL
ncbi:MAG: outer membrane beta-barrel protein [Candidatus Zixiibacteriota bacterium]